MNPTTRKETPPRPPYALEVGLRSGHTLQIRLRHWKFTMRNGVFTGYEFEGLDSDIGLMPSEIVYYREIKE